MISEAGGVWREPARGGYADRSFLGLDGMQRMRAVMRGELPTPPIHHLTGLAPIEVGPGTSTFSMPASPWLLSPPGVFTAGVTAFLADAPLGTAIATALPPGKVAVTSDLTMSFLRPASPASVTLIGRARLIHAGRSLGLSEILVEDGRGKLLAHGTSRCFLVELVSPPPEPPELLEPWKVPEYDTPDPYLRPVEGEVVPQEAWDTLSGLEVMRKLASGDLPASPLANLLGTRVVEAEEGVAAFAVPATQWLTSPAVSVYGGSLALVADLALTLAVGNTLPPRTVQSPLDLKVNFLRPVFADGRDLTARARVTHRGRSMAVASGEILNADGKPVAVATSSHIILPDRAWTAEAPVVQADEASAEEEES